MTISAYIKRDLEWRLRSGENLPSELTLEALSNYYGVSFTPVRAAVAQLVEEGLLLKTSNGRLQAADCPRDGDVSPITHEPPRDLLEIVRDDLVQLSLGGECRFVREAAAAERYGVSRSAMRFIFHRLAGMGLLTHVPRRGWQLRPFRQEDVHAFLRVREVLELEALETARPHLVDDDLRCMLGRNVVPESDDEWPQSDNSLHAYIIEKAGNPYISDFFARHSSYCELVLKYWGKRDREATIEALQQHRAILEALLCRDWPAARDELAWHIRCNHPRLSKIVASGSQSTLFPSATSVEVQAFASEQQLECAAPKAIPDLHDEKRITA